METTTTRIETGVNIGMVTGSEKMIVSRGGKMTTRTRVVFIFF